MGWLEYSDPILSDYILILNSIEIQIRNRKERDRLKKTTVTVSYDEEKLKALRLYLELKGCKLEDELTKIIDTLYTKTVPSGVREYIGMTFGEEPLPATPKGRRNRGRDQEEQEEPIDG